MSDDETRYGLRVTVAGDLEGEVGLNIEGSDQSTFTFTRDGDDVADEALAEGLAEAIGKVVQSRYESIIAGRDFAAIGDVMAALSANFSEHAGTARVRDGIDRADGELEGSDVTIEFVDGLAFDIEAGDEAAKLNENAGASRQ